MHRFLVGELTTQVCAALAPNRFVKLFLKKEKGALRLNNHLWDCDTGRVGIIAIGKAAAAMCRAALDIIAKENRADCLLTAEENSVSGAICIPGAHPYPDANSVKAGAEALRVAASMGENDLLLCLISGGGSAMIEAPAEGISLQDLRRTGKILLESGMPIAAINTIRGAVSRIKNGGLLEACGAGTCFSLIMSDVDAGAEHVVASGPTLKAPDDRKPLEIVKKYHLEQHLPASVLARLKKPRPPAAVTPSPVRHVAQVIADNEDARFAAFNFLHRHHIKAEFYPHELRGEARRQGRELAGFLRDCHAGTALVAGGETTVKLRGDGKGGRCMELLCGFALAAQSWLQGQWLAVCFGTDGIDGPTDAAGAYLDETIWTGGARQLKEFENALKENDSYPLFERLNALIKTGPTETNLRDLFVFVRWR